MSYVKRKGDPKKYWMVDAKCIGCKCFAPGLFQHRGATGSGSRNTGTPDSPVCLNNAYHGCPDDRGYSEDVEKQRKAEGWKRA